MLSFEFPFDACQLPLNGFDAGFRSFQARVLPELARQRIAAIGMKSLGGDGRAIERRAARITDALRYAMSLPVCTTISGIDSARVLRQNVRIARGFSPMSARERRAYERSLTRIGGRRAIRAVQDDRRARRRGRPRPARVPVAGRDGRVRAREAPRGRLRPAAASHHADAAPPGERCRARWWPCRPTRAALRPAGPPCRRGSVRC